MSRRLEKVNKHIQRTLGEILQKEADLPPQVLVTISRVDTTANLKSTTIWLSIYPQEARDTTLEVLTKQLYDIQGSLNRKLDFRPLPRLLLRIDYGAEHAENVQRALGQLAQEKDDEPTAGSVSGHN